MPHRLLQHPLPRLRGIDWQRNKLLALVRGARSSSGTSTSSAMHWRSLALRSTTSGDACMQPMRPTGSSVGADVAIALWRLTQGEGWLAAPSGNRVALPVTRFVYDRFADLLFAWNRWSGRWSAHLGPPTSSSPPPARSA
nr:hypothetical protein BDOA9_0102740 [Bradyrhizobium sp. DOA9]